MVDTNVEFFPEFNAGFQYILVSKELCADEYARYKEAPHSKELRYSPEHDDAADRELNRRFNFNRQRLLMDCIFDNTPEGIKTNLASAQVLLGVTPTLLALLAPQAWQIALIVRVCRSYLLGMLIALGSPTLTPSLTSDARLTDTVGNGNRAGQVLLPSWIYRLSDHKGGNSNKKGKAMYIASRLVVYLLVVAAISNVAQIVWSLMTMTSLAFSIVDVYLLVLWSCAGLIIHSFGTLSTWWRVKHRRSADPAPCGFLDKHMKDLLSGKKRRVDVLPPDVLSVSMTWLTAVLTVIHTFFGTWIFANITFISPLNAAVVVVRLVASVLSCRLVTEYEILTQLRHILLVESTFLDREDDKVTEVHLLSTLPRRDTSTSAFGSAF